MPETYWSDPLHYPHHSHWYDQFYWWGRWGPHDGPHRVGWWGPEGTPAAAKVTAADLAAFLNVPDTTPGLPELLQIAVDEVHALAYCNPWTNAHNRAVLYVAQAYRASSNHALGVVEAGDFGTVYLPRKDSRVLAILKDHLRGGFA